MCFTPFGFQHSETCYCPIPPQTVNLAHIIIFSLSVRKEGRKSGREGGRKKKRSTRRKEDRKQAGRKL